MRMIITPTNSNTCNVLLISDEEENFEIQEITEDSPSTEWFKSNSSGICITSYSHESFFKFPHSFIQWATNFDITSAPSTIYISELDNKWIKSFSFETYRMIDIQALGYIAFLFSRIY